MSDTVFTEVRYSLGNLLNDIELGEIGLPEIQRPFVWKNAKVRDLFDSMYKGYPVGYLLFWESGHADDSRSIGTDAKQKLPRILIVDGQQRLTSLYAVIRGVNVVQKDYQSKPIEIAFNPLAEKFEVADAAIRRNKAYIPNISALWESGARITKIIREYLAGLDGIRDVTDDEESAIEESIQKVLALTSYPFTALELSAEIDDEDVADVFVRINSEGIPLNQADFILTLMSVFWDEGRTDLENFSRDSRIPSTDRPSSFNHFIEPDPAQLLRASVVLGFKRARLQHVYSILRGKDLETEQFSDERRVQQFEVLKKAQARVLNLQYWHDFFNCIKQAGYRSTNMISSVNNLMFSYALYLMGRTEYGVDEFRLRGVIARWFFMSSLTGRFTSSPESSMEFDLARLRGTKDTDSFVATLEGVSNLILTDDYWTNSLPNALATSSPRSPSLYAYQASLVLLDARALFSRLRIGELIDPMTQAQRSAIERHHLFPRNHLNTLGITDLREVNQIANYAQIEWGDNTSISDRDPKEYVPELAERFSQTDLDNMYFWHALPEDWEHLEYSSFLERRREMMAQVIRAGYETLLIEQREEDTVLESSVVELVSAGESEEVEFKSTLRVNLHTNQKDPRVELGVLKTLAGFLNTRGGRLVIGVTDDGSPVGIEADGFPDHDKLSLHLVNLVNSRMGPHAMTRLHLRFDDYEDHDVLVVEADRAVSPIFVRDGNDEHFYVRTGPATSALSGRQTQEYIKERF